MRYALLIAATLVARIPLAAADDVVKADALFDQGKALMATDLNGACGKFEAAYQLNPHAIGILLNVALCDEKLGRIASAAARFTLAKDMAIEQHLPEHIEAANEHLAALTPRIPHVTFTATALPANTTIVVDDKLIVKPSALANIAIDPGTHHVEVTAPGFLPYETKFAIADGEHRDVAFPLLEKATSTSRTRKKVGVVIAAGGAAIGITAIVLGYTAKSRRDTAWEHGGCSDEPVPHCDDAEDVSKINSAHTLGNVSTAIGITGVVAIGVGAYLFLSAPRAQTREGVAVVPQLSAEGAGIAAVGRF